MSAGLLDPQLAHKANNKETCNAVFFKLLATYIQTLIGTGKLPWKSCKEIVKHCIYIMDKSKTINYKT
jgi:hypothetical protein